MPPKGLLLSRGFLDRPTLTIWLERWMETQGRDGEFLAYLEARHQLGETGMGLIDSWVIRDGVSVAEMVNIVWDRLEEYAAGIQEMEPQCKFLPSFGKDKVPGPPYPFKYQKPMFGEAEAADGGADALLAGPLDAKSFNRMLVQWAAGDRKMTQICNAENFRQLLAINQALFASLQASEANLARARGSEQTAFEAMHDAADMSHVHRMDAEKQAKSDLRKDAFTSKVTMLLPYAIQMGLTKLFGPAVAKAVVGTNASNPQLEKIKGALSSILSTPGVFDKLSPIIFEANPVGAKILIDVVQEWVGEADQEQKKVQESVDRVVPPPTGAPAPNALPGDPPVPSALAKVD